MKSAAVRLMLLGVSLLSAWGSRSSSLGGLIVVDDRDSVVVGGGEGVRAWDLNFVLHG
jgi:hypothetical protein